MKEVKVDIEVPKYTPVVNKEEHEENKVWKWVVILFTFMVGMGIGIFWGSVVLSAV